MFTCIALSLQYCIALSLKRAHESHYQSNWQESPQEDLQKSERAESSIDTEPRKLFEFICTVRVLAASLHCCVRSFLDLIALSMHTMCSNDSDWLMSTNSLKAGCMMITNQHASLLRSLQFSNVEFTMETKSVSPPAVRKSMGMLTQHQKAPLESVRQTKCRNPRCAYAPRVNYNSLHNDFTQATYVYNTTNQAV